MIYTNLYVIIALTIILLLVRYYHKPSKKSSLLDVLNTGEIDKIVDNWVPQPLVTPRISSVDNKEVVIVGSIGAKTILSDGRVVTNLASYNFYDFASNEQVKTQTIQALRHYGVERDIASYLGLESCAIYAQSFSIISSVIPAFSKKGDVIIADKAAHHSIRTGIKRSGSTETVTAQVGKRLTRRFIIAEALSENVGDVLDLPKLIELKERYKFRLILDETLSFGVLGKGRGITEAQNVDTTQIDMIIGSFAGPLCAGGGFCAGSQEIIDHQRIASPVYTFSAGLPALLTVTASEAMNILQRSPEILKSLRENVQTMRTQLDLDSWFVCTSSPDNPIMLYTLRSDFIVSQGLSITKQNEVLQDWVDEVLLDCVLITRLKSTPIFQEDTALVKDEWQIQPALKICITTALSKTEVKEMGFVISRAIAKVFNRKTLNSK